jgi:hypothetical protein
MDFQRVSWIPIRSSRALVWHRLGERQSQIEPLPDPHEMLVSSAARRRPPWPSSSRLRQRWHYERRIQPGSVRRRGLALAHRSQLPELVRPGSSLFPNSMLCVRTVVWTFFQRRLCLRRNTDIPFGNGRTAAVRYSCTRRNRQLRAESTQK